jgi:hypothetical protein
MHEMASTKALGGYAVVKSLNICRLFIQRIFERVLNE